MTDDLANLIECFYAQMCVFVSACVCQAVLLGAVCTSSFSLAFMQECCFLDNLFPDAAITMGMVLLNEAATSKGDVGKRRSKYSKVLVCLHYFLMSFCVCVEFLVCFMKCGGCYNYSGMLFLLAASNVYALKYVFEEVVLELERLMSYTFTHRYYSYMCLLIKMSYSHIQEVLTRKCIRLLFAVWPR